MPFASRRKSILRLILIFTAVPVVVSLAVLAVLSFRDVEADRTDQHANILAEVNSLSKTLSTLTLSVSLENKYLRLMTARSKQATTALVSASSGIQRIPTTLREVAITAFHSGHFESSFHDDLWTVAAPVSFRNGKVKRFLLYSQVSISRQDLFLTELKKDQWALALTLILSLLSGFGLVDLIIRMGQYDITIRSLTKSARRSKFAFVDIFLTCVVCAILGMAAIALQNLSRLSQDKLQSALNLKNLEHLTIQFDNSISTGKHLTSFQLSNLALINNLSDLAANFEHHKTLNTNGIERVLNQEESKLNSQKSAFDASENEFMHEAQGVFLFAAIMSLSTLVLWRASISKQRHLEVTIDQAVASYRLYRSLSDSLPIGLFLYHGSQIESYNQAWTDMMQRDPKSSHEVDWWLRVHPEDQIMLLTKYNESEQKVQSVEMPFRILSRDGSIQHLSTQLTPILNQDGTLKHLLGFTLDETARVLAEQESLHKQELLKESVSMLHATMKNLEDTMESVLHSLVRAVEAKDFYIAGHSERVMMYSVMLGERLGLSSIDLRVLEVGGLVHDVGKIGIPDHILLKPGRLNDDEYAVVQRHPEIGSQMLNCLSTFLDCLPIVRYHHERIDGSGYPCGLRGSQIPLLVQIASLADEFDAMTSARAYRSELSCSHALTLMQKEAENGKLDPALLEVFADMVNKEGILWRPVASKDLRLVA